MHTRMVRFQVCYKGLDDSKIVYLNVGEFHLQEFSTLPFWRSA